LIRILGNADKSEWQTPWRCQLLFSRRIFRHSTQSSVIRAVEKCKIFVGTLNAIGLRVILGPQ
jgi:hypothetical protein